MRISKKCVTAALVAMTTMSSTAFGQALLVDDFSGTGGPDSTKWTVSTQNNGSPFGCTFATSEVWKSGGNLILNVNPNTDKCAEVKSVKSDFKYGKYLVRVTPSTFAGGNTSFFLYTGTTGGATNHYEIDIEIINGGKTLHTNYFVKGSDNGGKNVKQFNLGAGLVQLGFEWRANTIRWFWVGSDGKENNYRTANVSISNNMNLFMNHWYSDNSASGVGFLGEHTGGGGQAKYDKVEVYK
ncbi:glycoside hydrolase family 16 protein [Sphingorhabdus arenilitoris]|uniref:Glycoside hydrolase family 16 protein n=1 Tax=Sphingorhabdus arenilitoris TaxID=1490041 RepID=A0ABV8RIQ8_9SPHN